MRFIIYTDLKNQDTLMIGTLMIGTKVSTIHRLVVPLYQRYLINVDSMKVIIQKFNLQNQ